MGLEAKYNEAEMMDILMKMFNVCDSDKQSYALRYKNAWLYYAGYMPEDKNKTGVDPVCIVRDAVEQDYQIFKTLFNSSNNSVVSVRSNNMKAALSEAVSQALNDVAMNLNGVNRKMEGFIKETLLTGQSHMKVHLVDRIHDEREHHFEDYTQEKLNAVIQAFKDRGFNEVVETIKSSRTKRTDKAEREMADKLGLTAPKSYKLLSGSIRAISRTIYPEIDYIPFEEVFIHPLTRNSLDDGPYFCHRYMMSIADGLANGWSYDDMQTGYDSSTTDPSYSNTGLIVGNPHNPFETSGAGIAPVNDSDYFPVYEHYWYGAYKGKFAGWWKFTTTNLGFLQEPERIDEVPFVSARIMEIPNSFYGQGLYDTTKSMQDQKTQYIRMTTYNAMNAAFGRFIAQKDMYDAESLMANRPGGVVEVEVPGAVTVMQHTDISNAMKELISDVNSRIKATMTTAGSIGDSVDKYGETAGVTMSMLIDKTEQSPKSRAATFAETGLIPLYKKLYHLMQAIQHPLKYAGGAIVMSDLPKDIGLTFDATTLTDKQQAAQNVLQSMSIAQQMNGGQMPNWIPAENQYEAIAANIRAGTGENDVSKYLTDPKTIKPSKAQRYMQGVQLKASAIAAKAGAEQLILKNQETLSAIRKNDATTALTAAQMKSLKEDDLFKAEEHKAKLNGMVLNNALTVAKVKETVAQADSINQDTLESPARFQLESDEINSQISAEQINAFNGNYAQGANVNVQ